MAYIFNSDGTVKTIDVRYEQDGGIVAKKNFSELERNEAEKQLDKKCLLAARVNGGYKTQKTTPNPPRSRNTQKKKQENPLFSSEDEIDKFFVNIKASKMVFGKRDCNVALSKLPKSLRSYFKKKYEEHKEDLRVIELTNRIGKRLEEIRKEIQIRYKNFKKKHKKKLKEQIKSRPANSGNTIGEIAKFSSFKKGGSESDIVYGRSLNGASRKPKYGYARDRFGRIQERDHLDENRRNEFKQAQRRQSNYDYSNYDSNDDHDGAYSGWD